MTTYISAPYSQPSTSATPVGDAEWQAWAGRVEAALSGCGLVQTADTGQQAAASQTYPASVNDWSRYQMWRFNDSLQATYPIFVKIMFGRVAQSFDVHIRVEVGTATDGAGNLVGVQGGPWTIGDLLSNSGGTASNLQNFSCHTEGYWMIVVDAYHPNMRMHASSAIAIARSRNQATGVFDGRGVVVLRADNAASEFNITSVRWDNAGFPTGYGGNPKYCIIPGTPADTTWPPGGDKRLFPHWYCFPNVEQCWATFTVRWAEIGGTLTTFVATPFPNGGQHTYACFGDDPVFYGDLRGTSTYRVAWLWE